MAERKITIINQLDQLELLADALESISEEWGIPMGAALNLNLVLEELVTNIIFYGYPDKTTHEINIRLTWERPVMQIEVEDDGIPFNPLLMPEPDLQVEIGERKIGGLGIHFVKKIMDQLAYVRSGNQNILTMKKFIA